MVVGQQILGFTYHKSGTVLLEQVLRRVAVRFAMTVDTRYGMATGLDLTTDIVLLPHSLLGFALDRPFRGVRIVRDPRDIWVSSYLYHCRCAEAWCVGVGDAAAPIGYPAVDFSMVHRPERWKRDYLRRLGGRSYRDNLRARDRADGLAFELAGYTGSTLEAMRGWRARPEVMDLQIEAIAADFDGAMGRMFRHLGFDAAQCEEAVGLAAAEDVARMGDAAVAANPHIHARGLSRWPGVLTAAQVAAFEAAQGDLIRSLGYVLSTGGDGAGCRI